MNKAYPLIFLVLSLAVKAQNVCPHEYLVVCPQIEAPRVTELREGKVTVEYSLNEDGAVNSINVVASEGDKRWEDSVINSVSEWQYLPSAKNKQTFTFIAEFSDE